MVESDSLTAEQFHGILAFISGTSDFSFEEAASQIAAALPRRVVRVIEEGGHRTIEVAAKRWRVWASLAEGSHVAEESREIAEWLQHHPRAPEIVGCRRRMEFEGTNVDQGSKCYQDMLQICQVLGLFSGVIVFDLEQGKLIGE